MAEFRLPDLGEGMTEAEIDRWLVNEGDIVAEDDILVDLITDKASAEIPSPFAGVVTKIHVEAGAIVPVGTVLVTIGESAEADGSAAAAPVEVAIAEPIVATPVATAPSSLRVKAMPPVRKLARELGVDLAEIEGTGPQGRILREDVEIQAAQGRHPAGGSTVPPAPTSIPGRREPLRGVRRTIADRMLHAHLAIPPVTHVEECDVTELEATRALANERFPEQKLTFLPFIVKAVVGALKTYPALNSSLDEDAGEIVFHDAYNIGIAVDTPAGLTVPVVHDADRKKLREIATEIETLAEKARAGRLTMEELRGGTFTVSSPGPFGGLLATPIIMHPQAAILGVHRATERPVVRDGQVVIRKIMNLSVTFDHRILDGMTGAKFILDVANLLEHPAVIALEA